MVKSNIINFEAKNTNFIKSINYKSIFENIGFLEFIRDLIWRGVINERFVSIKEVNKNIINSKILNLSVEKQNMILKEYFKNIIDDAISMIAPDDVLKKRYEYSIDILDKSSSVIDKFTIFNVNIYTNKNIKAEYSFPIMQFGIFNVENENVDLSEETENTCEIFSISGSFFNIYSTSNKLKNNLMERFKDNN